MSTTKIKTPLLWELNSLRVSIFPLFEEQVKKVELDFIKNIWPKDKEVKLENTKIYEETGQIVLEGVYKGYRIQLVGTAFKIDLIAIPKDPINATKISLVTLGAFMEKIGELAPFFQTWLAQDGIPKILRFAFAPELISRVKTHRDAYNLISQYLPFQVNPENS